MQPRMESHGGWLEKSFDKEGQSRREGKAERRRAASEGAWGL